MAWSLHRNLGFPLDLVDLMLEERGTAADRRAVERLAAEHEQVFTLSRNPAMKVSLHVLEIEEILKS